MGVGDGGVLARAAEVRALAHLEVDAGPGEAEACAVRHDKADVGLTLDAGVRGRQAMQVVDDLAEARGGEVGPGDLQADLGERGAVVDDGLEVVEVDGLGEGVGGALGEGELVF